MQRNEDIKKNIAGGSAKVFPGYGESKRTQIVQDFSNILNYYNGFFDNHPNVPAVAKIIMIEEAIAKSHKPNDLCKDCEIIGAGALNEIYIKVTKDGISKTIERINKNSSIKMHANVSAIEKILPIDDEEKISDRFKNYIKSKTLLTVQKLKVKLFKFDDDYDDISLINYINVELEKLNINRKYQKRYGDALDYLVLEDVKVSDIKEIIKLNGIREVDIFYEYGFGPSKNKTTKKSLIPNEILVSDTVIGIIDSGIIDKDMFNSQIIGREEYVPFKYQNRAHGTFVASQILFGSELNSLSENNPKRFKMLDIIAIPNGDSDFGPTAILTQEELYEIIEEVMEKYSKTVKIWNLSLGSASVLARDNFMSDLGVFCDFIQDKYGVQFLIAAGNYEGVPFRTWPAQFLGESDRISSPADSSRALAIGSIA